MDINDNMYADIDEYCDVTEDANGCQVLELLQQQPDEKAEPAKKPRHWIRLQGHADIDLESITTQQDVFRRIQQVTEYQSQFGRRADLYPRRWVPSSSNQSTRKQQQQGTANGANVNGEPSAPPLRVSDDDAADNDKIVSVLQFNALAEGLSAGPDVRTPFSHDPYTDTEAKSKNEYGGFTSVPDPHICLNFDLRKWRLLEVLLGTTTSSDSDNQPLFDLIAMEEVDRYRGFFSPLLQMFGYHGLFLPKPNSPAVRLGWYSDGCALFYKANKFQLVSERRLAYTNGNQVLVLATLRHVPTNQLVIVAVTHLKAQTANEGVRCAQITELLHHVQHQAEHLQQQEQQDVSVIIMGDLNADPPSSFCQKDNDDESCSCVHGILNSDEVSLESAYSLDDHDNDDDSFFTTWKTRGTKTVRRVIDYIFHASQGMECTHVLNIPTAKEMEEHGLPGLRYPSDHVAIGAKFKLK